MGLLKWDTELGTFSGQEGKKKDLVAFYSEPLPPSGDMRE